MKRIASFLLALALLIPCAAVADEVTPEIVLQKTIIVKMPDVIREGLYTGEMQNSVPHGYGLFETVNSSGIKWHYIGTWVNGAMTGEGAQYWNSGDSQIGLFENGQLICGDIHNSSGKHTWVDYRPDEQGRIKVKLYREDDSIYFDGHADAKTGGYTEGIFYNKNGKVFFEGKIGDGFDWNYIYIE